MSEAPRPRTGAAPHPMLRAMLICDYTIRDDQSGKVSVIGIFSDVQAADVPVMHPALCVYVNVDDAEGEYAIRLELVRVEDDAVIGKGEMMVQVADRMKGTELVFQLKNILFDRYGAYEFRVWANDRHVGTKTFHVGQTPKGGRQ